jgi:hypothetical protein
LLSSFTRVHVHDIFLRAKKKKEEEERRRRKGIYKKRGDPG